MSKLKEGLATFLLAQSLVTDIVAARVYPQRIPQKTPRPAVTYQVVGTDTDYHSTGASGLSEVDVTILCHGNDKGEAEQLADVVEPLLSGYRGPLGSAHVRAVFLDDRRDEEVAATDGSDRHFPAVALDFVMHWKK